MASILASLKYSASSSACFIPVSFNSMSIRPRNTSSTFHWVSPCLARIISVILIILNMGVFVGVGSYKNLGVITPGDDALDRLTCGLQFVCREVPIRVADSYANDYPPGFRYAGILSRYFREHYALVLDASAETVV